MNGQAPRRTIPGPVVAIIIVAAGSLGAWIGVLATVGTIAGQHDRELAALDVRVDSVEEASWAQATVMGAMLDDAELGGPIDPSSLAEALATKCPTEDSVNCYWLSGVNGAGSTFVNVEGHLFPASWLEVGRD